MEILLASGKIAWLFSEDVRWQTADKLSLVA